MKRYLVFGCREWEGGCGWNDFKESFDSIDEAKSRIENSSYEWWNIVDTTTGKIILDDLGGK